MPHGKPAGTACIHLADNSTCLIYDKPNRPGVCAAFKADPEVCGTTRKEAMMVLGDLERGIAP